MRTILEDISEPASGFFSEKRSDFYGYAAHITCSADIDIFLQKIQKMHPDARHVVWAALFRDNTHYIISHKAINEADNNIANNDKTSNGAAINKVNKNNRAHKAAGNSETNESAENSENDKTISAPANTVSTGNISFDSSDFLANLQQLQGVSHEKLSDDGEPSGTGGVPLLNLLKRQNLDNSIVAVARKFGGILLGAGGLMRAYSASAENTLAHSRSVDLVPVMEIKTVMNYQQWSSFETMLYSYRGIMRTTDFAAKVSCSFSVPASYWNELQIRVQNTYGGKVILYPQSVQLNPLAS